MEAALLTLEQETTLEKPKLSQNDWVEVSKAAAELVEALKQALSSRDVHPTEEESKQETVTAEWLLNVCRGVQSALGAEQLARAIWSAAQLADEAQQQAALFDALGESGMDVLFQVAEVLPQIKQIPQHQLKEKSPSSSSAAAAAASIRMDPEEERRMLLLEEARSAAQVAAMAQAEVDLANAARGSGTHTVTRRSDLQAEKAAKKAAKRAEAALKAARAAGAIVDQQDWMTLANTEMGSGGLMGRSNEELWQLQQSLQPEGTRHHYDKQGLPAGTEREYGPNYEKVTIPAARRDESQLPRRLPIAEIMDDVCAKAFAGTTSLNPMQSSVFETAFRTRQNLLVCAPTGAGKTNVALLTIMAHFRDVGLLPGHNDKAIETGKKVVYIAPMKALAQEVVEKFNSKLNRPLGLIVRELTGDMQLTRAEAASANVLVTTPEKWDVVTRKSGNDDTSLGNQCGLLIIDEVHLLADDRGAVIESVVARLHRLVESRQRQVRIVGLSATLPNYEDVATFLQVQPKGLFFFGPEHRPVPLQQQFIGVNAKTKDRYLKEKQMNEICYDVVVDALRRGYQVMVFVHSRKGTGETATALTEKAQEDGALDRLFITKGKEGPNGDAHSRFVDRVSKSRNREVSLHFGNGFGIHHAGMLRGDRKLTEQVFAAGAIKVLCCTATLAWGINLPAHTVIVKGTDVYNPEKGAMQDLSILDVQQIFGRAGRPQFDSSGEATLITTHDAVQRYLDKLVRAVPIESNFIKQLADHLNAEVVGGTVTTIEEAATWLTYTYLYVRMLRNPLAYGITADQKADDPMLHNRSRELVTEAAKLLDGNKMLSFHMQSGNLGTTQLGRVAAHFYIQAESVDTFNRQLGSNQSSPSDADLCYLICCATEFENVRIRQEELSDVDNLAIKACPLEVKKPIHEAADKAMVLLQAYISRYNIRSFTLISDTNYIASNAGRVARAMFEMCLKQSRAAAAVKLLRIAKSVDRRMWWFQTPLRQFEGELKAQTYAALESHQSGAQGGYDTFEAILSLLDLQPKEVGQLIHWNKGGEKVQKLIEMLPNLEIEFKVQPVTSSVLRFHIKLHPVFRWQSRWHGGAEGFWVWVEDDANNRIYHFEYIVLSRRTHPESVTLDFAIPVFNPRPKQYFIRALSDSWVGVEMLIPVPFKDIKLPSQQTPFTDLADLTPLPTSALQNPKYEQLFTRFETFNPIQTQLFHVLYHTDAPVLLGAPTGSGKTTVAELALLRMKRIHPQAVCVYIAPLKSLARERLREWRNRLGGAPLNWSVLELSGDTHHDQKTLNRADVLVCTPEKWDLISRGWKGQSTVSDSNIANGKAFVKRVRLLVIDEIHLLGEDRGAVLEAIVSRTRYISQFMEKKTDNKQDKQTYEWTRIIGLSTALANPYDLADWIGIETKGYAMTAKRGLYNFRPSVRPVVIDVHVQGYDGRHYCPRMATMNKPCYAAIKQHSPTKPTLIFVASRRQTRLTALDIISYAAGDENPRAFLNCGEDYIESVAEGIEDQALRHTITFGIGIHHAGLSSNDRDIVENLFLNGQILVLVATATLAWGVNLPAHLVIVKGTEYFDGKTSRYVDYPITDVLQMMGRAGRPGFDKLGVAVVMVAQDKKDFYKRFLYTPFPVESCLNERMAENLNAEIAIGTINSIVDAVGYLTWTFYARRVKGNPSYYGAASSSDDDVEDFLLKVVEDTLEKLKEHKCVDIEQGSENDRAVTSTILGRTATNYYLQYRTPRQMLFGVDEARKIVSSLLEENSGAVVNLKPNELVPFTRSIRVDEVSLAWILYAVASTHEFDELPVRHNEDQLNADLSEKVMWGADTSTILNPGGPSKHVNVDVMADPHTKCFLLLQAFLERAELPISDYINDTKTVVDQIPRLLAAMQYIALEDKTIAGNFELLCQFSRVRAIFATRTMVETDPLSQLWGFTKDVMRRLRNRAKSNKLFTPSLWELRSKTRDEAAKLLTDLLKGQRHDLKRMLDSVYAIPLYTLQETKVSHQVEKASGKSVGKLEISLEISYENVGRRPKKDDGALSIVVLLGTRLQRTLLAHSSFRVSRSGNASSPTKKKIEMEFDWSAANAGGGEEGGNMVLRFLMEDLRGLDTEVAVPLSEKLGFQRN